MRPPRRPTAGLTLLELLLSLAMMAALALILASSFDVIGRALQRLDPARSAAGPLLERTTLRRWIEAMPREVPLQAAEGTLTFETVIDDGLFWPGVLATVTLAREGDALVAVAVTPDAPGHPGQTRRLVLSREVSEVGFAFLPLAESGTTDWRDDWPVGPALPDLLRITYDVEGRMTPPLTVMPARDARYSVMSLSSPLPPG